MTKYDSSYIGSRYNRLVVKDVYLRKVNGHSESIFTCICDCGNTKHIKALSVVKGITKSCGCLQKEVTSSMSKKHGMHKTRIYRIWHSMKRRATRKIGESVDRFYYDKGIRICDEWSGENGFENFYKWSIENGYTDELTIDRIDSNSDYSPKNCRWATYKEQSNNTSRNHYVVYNNERHTVGEWATILGINYNTLNQRIWSGIPIEIAMSTKKFKRGEMKKLIEENK